VGEESGALEQGVQTAGYAMNFWAGVWRLGREWAYNLEHFGLHIMVYNGLKARYYIPKILTQYTYTPTIFCPTTIEKNSILYRSRTPCMTNQKPYTPPNEIQTLTPQHHAFPFQQYPTPSLCPSSTTLPLSNAIVIWWLNSWVTCIVHRTVLL